MGNAITSARVRVANMGEHGPLNPVLIDVPMPIRTPRLLIRPKQIGDGTITSAAVAETWEDLHKWMRWAENQEGFTAELMEIRNPARDGQLHPA